MPPRLTRKGEETRRRIVEGAVSLMRERGPDVSLDDVRAATATSKSQLFHYFPDGRVQLLEEAARHEAEQVLADQRPALDDLGDWPSWEDWRDQVVARYEAQGRHCPLRALMSRLSAQEHDEIVADLFARWQESLASGVTRMQAAGRMATGLTPAEAAAALLAAVQGGVVILLATGDSVHLRLALSVVLDRLRP
ncbi:TetR family transcriptional regulator [Actinocorallia herbida]|uniref:TetR family transcriptional regulator n=1 Tax=Actinocorallia herbida TaxID=58109 RepID=A0A3N1CUA8_9ACTN|nr:TetR/AcrR family transcriptional regulator [Actinocorallia herbida]ROO84805.1 TetR family transcriptional regulator [Actinocorallia herbida]